MFDREHEGGRVTVRFFNNREIREMFTFRVDSEEGLMDLAIRARSRNEFFSFWNDEENTLTVLFDDKRGLSWQNYTEGYYVAPSVTAIFERDRFTSSGEGVSGLRFYDPRHTLSYLYRSRYGSKYEVYTKEHNTKKQEVDLEWFWESHTMMTFALCQESEDIKLLADQCEAFRDIIKKNLSGTQAHIPLLVNPGDANIH
jgi:hypothetical protein